LILTPGAIDCHVHFICPQLVDDAVTSGKFQNLKQFILRVCSKHLMHCIHESFAICSRQFGCDYATFLCIKTSVTTKFLILQTHFLIQSFSALYIGITTLVGGGTGPADGTRATTCTPAPNQMKMMLQSTDDMPLNFGFTGKVCYFSFCFIHIYI